MKPERTFERSVQLPVSATEAFAWHARPGAFERLTPPWEVVEVNARSGGITDGSWVMLHTRQGLLWARWEIEHHGYVEGREFHDRMVRGPFAAWGHRHGFSDGSDGLGVLTDTIRYRLPFGAAGEWAARRFVERKLARMFAYRHAVTAADLALWKQHAAAPRLRVLVSGAGGLVGRTLVPMLTTQGHEVVRLVRHAPLSADEVTAGQLDRAGRIDAVVHLAGEPIAGGPWTADRRRRILESRVEGTRTLVDALCRLSNKPAVFIGASAIGIYGDRGEAPCDEHTVAGAGFLADVCTQWERETARAEQLGIRTVRLRTGVVLSPAGGALGRMLPAFRAGLGGRLGSGRQWMSWISIDDLARVMVHALADPRMSGPVNAVAPQPVRNAEFAALLGRVLRRPAKLPVPAKVLRLALGRLADEALLAGARVQPGALQEAGYAFRHENLEAALRHVLGRTD